MLLFKLNINSCQVFMHEIANYRYKGMKCKIQFHKFVNSIIISDAETC